MTARAITVLGNNSHTGKSLLCIALRHIVAQQGYRVAKSGLRYTEQPMEFT